MLCSEGGIPIPKKWEHDPSIHNYEGDTVESILRSSCLTVPS